MGKRTVLWVLLSFSGGAWAAGDQAAKAKFQAGKTAYDLGEFDQALVRYTEAYKLKPLPAFLFNIAQCHRQLKNYERASFFYKRYLSLQKKATNAAQVKELIAEMDQKLAEAKDAETKRKSEVAAAPALEPPLKSPPPQQAKWDTPLEHSPTDGAPTAPPLPIADESPVPLAPLVVVNEAEDRPLYKQWWFWTATAAVATAAAVGVVVATSQKPEEVASLGVSSWR